MIGKVRDGSYSVGAVVSLFGLNIAVVSQIAIIAAMIV